MVGLFAFNVNNVVDISNVNYDAVWQNNTHEFV